MLSTQPAWTKAVTRPAREFASTQLEILEGKIPAGLRGTLYRNGPARLERGGMRMGHWFDGDGAILAVRFADSPVGGSKATATYRYVQTTGYQAEAAAGKLLYGNYGTIAPGPIWRRWRTPVKNSANTSVLALPDRLLALWEGGKPHALDLQTLETQGKDDLSGLGENLNYSAHPKRDPKTGEIFNFGVSAGSKTNLHLYRSDATGKIVHQSAFPLDGVPLIHDFVLAGEYLVFFVPPVRLDLFPALVGLKSFGNGMKWHAQQGTQILIFDRRTLSLVSRQETEPWFQWHFANGYRADTGEIIVDFIRYRDFTTNQRLKEVATGRTQTVADGTLWRVQLDGRTGKVLGTEELLDRSCEFPIVPPQYVGGISPHIYLSLHRPDADRARELYGAIARFDDRSGTLTIADLGENRYPSEPIFAPDALDADRGWVLTVVYDGNLDRSEVWVYHSSRLDEEPTCRLALPDLVSLGFHGTWKPALGHRV
ncbi:carotenoid oxygenase family protein [Oscillatoriales cyanobacterium LEGE 11467]|uniref:Carotenoid oxygenase family protein n=1 Tax=Zarconia navalis LEGE 11467 TaxID=1828826 RepID=A0A928VXA4_9CYAN|nr:carotenoid oxygenase family protein [Zarconia navalis]MBE9041294.1 carotenoid oxygenase family protein [Zarconia navalis LEGE 11467]